MAPLPGRDPVEDGLRCQRCTCKWCGYALREGSCWICSSRDENSSIDVYNPNSFNDLPNVFTHPPQPQYKTYSCELCGNDSHYGYDCPLQFPLVYEQEPSYNQNYGNNYYPQNSPSCPQQYFCCENCGGPHGSFQCQPMNQNYFEPNYSGFDQPPQYSINHQPSSIQENPNQKKMYELLQVMQSFCEKLLQQTQAASIDQSPLQEMSIQDMEDLKQHYLDEMLSLSNDLQIKDYRNEKIDIRFRRECESMIDKLKGKFNGMSIEINKKKELQHLEQVAKLSTYTTEPSRRFNSFYDYDDDEESTIPLNEIVSQIPPSIAITPSSVEDLVPIPSESEDTSESDSECKLPSCDDFSPINISEEKSVNFSNPLFNSNDDYTSSDDESLSDEDVLEDNMKIYSNPLFEFDNEYISSNVNPLFDKVLEDIECKVSYDFNLDEPTLLVTPLSDSNEDECLAPGDEIELLLHHDSSTLKMSIASILEGFTDEPPLEENDDLFDLESKTNEYMKILYDALINDLMTKDKIFDPGGDIDEIDAFLDIDISTNIKDSYYDSEGDITYLESLLIDDTILSLPPKVFLDHDPRSLSDINDLKIMVKVFDPGIHEKKFSPTYVKLPFEDRHYLSFTYVIRIFLPYFTYPVESLFLLSSGSEDTIFDHGISAFYFSYF
ncbi:hypothetical protein Tco_1507951 [Tanacetum coccineum]